MQNKPDQTVPVENQLEAMLADIKPQPTARFYHKMQAAPWVKAAAPDKSRLSRSWKPTARFIWGLVALVFTLMFLAVVFIPSVRAVARQIINSFIFEQS